MSTYQGIVSREREVRPVSGGRMLTLCLLLLAVGIALFIYGVSTQPKGWALGGITLGVLAVVLSLGLYTLQPNEARLREWFDDVREFILLPTEALDLPLAATPDACVVMDMVYKPLVTPFLAQARAIKLAAPKKHPRMKVSLRARNLNGDRLKVNDKQGNPIEIAAVIIWRVQDTAQAMFDVDDYEEYVRLQAESALRHLGSQYAYDNAEPGEVTLRSGMDEVSQTLAVELSQRLARSGVTVDEARLTHLAYAPEIAQAMLRRQQAEAEIAARQKIVQGAVGMVDMALRDLAERNVVDLDPERKAAMVSNLLVVLCGESDAKPVINAGTLYS